ncbi:MAG: hypothetical protein JRG94_08295 [Deltaproteobacteria bacterium]|nr:hypothetical protein [Deltaproteobacteria bacterium]
MSRSKAAVAVLVLTSFTIPITSSADGDSQHEFLHFSHPLISESPSPDTKIRTDYIFRNETGEESAKIHVAQLEAEYAFRPWISVETNIPLTFRNPDDGKSRRNLDTIEIGVKLATFALADHGVLLGGGIEFGLPTGDSSKGIGSSHILEVEPFIDFGFKHQDLEIVGFLSPAVPTNKNGEDEADVELGWSLSMLYHLHRRVEVLLEFDGERAFGGEESGHATANISPGLKVVPTANQNLQIGVGVSLPISDDEDFDVRTILSVFYHF